MSKQELEQQCPYCDREVEERGIVWGANLWHPECYEAYGRDWDDWDRYRLGIDDSTKQTIT